MYNTGFLACNILTTLIVSEARIYVVGVYFINFSHIIFSFALIRMKPGHAYTNPLPRTI